MVTRDTPAHRKKRVVAEGLITRSTWHTLNREFLMEDAVAHVTLADAKDVLMQALETGMSPLGLPAALLFEHGSLKLYLYEPIATDQQPVHDQDEVYVVTAGTGLFAIGATEDTLERRPFGPGDAIFVPAGSVHRFENFTDDFQTWVIMYGPDGGERPFATETTWPAPVTTM